MLQLWHVFLLLLLPAVAELQTSCPELTQDPPFPSKNCQWVIGLKGSCRAWTLIGCTPEQQCQERYNLGFIYHKCSFPYPPTCGFRAVYNESQRCVHVPACQCGPTLYFLDGKCVKEPVCPKAWLAKVDGLKYPALRADAKTVTLTVHLPNYKRTISLRLSRADNVYTGHDTLAKGSEAKGVIVPEGGYFKGTIEYADGVRYVFGRGTPYIQPSELELLGFHSVVYDQRDVREKKVEESSKEM